MKRSIKILFTIMLALLVTAGMDMNAQSESVRESKSVSISSSNDGKVTLKVTTKQGNDTKIFEKTYDSHEEMAEDPELEEYGITADDLGFGSTSFFGSPRMRIFRSGPGMSFFGGSDEDDEPWSGTLLIDIDSLMDQMDHFRGGGPFSFSFGPGSHMHMDIDSMMSNFRGNGFFFGDDDFENIDSLRERMMDRFKDMDFDFDFDDDGNGSGFRVFSWGNNDEDEDKLRVISRVKVFIRSARDADKEKVGSDEMEDLQIKDISFYPNPSDGRFQLELETGNDMPVFIKIIGPNGEEVYSKNAASTGGFYDFNIDISNQREGIYILQVIQNGHALTKRIIIE